MQPLRAPQRSEHGHVRLRRAVRRRRRRRRACAPPSAPNGAGGRGRVLAFGEHFWRNTERIMGWDIKEDGFGVVLSPELPALMRKSLRPALRGFLAPTTWASTTSRASCSIPAAARCWRRRAAARPRPRRPAHSPDGAARFRQHVVGHGAVRARRASQPAQAAASAGRFRPGLLRLFRRGRSLSLMPTAPPMRRSPAAMSANDRAGHLKRTNSAGSTPLFHSGHSAATIRDARGSNRKSCSARRDRDRRHRDCSSKVDWRWKRQIPAIRSLW